MRCKCFVILSSAHFLHRDSKIDIIQYYVFNDLVEAFFIREAKLNNNLNTINFEHLVLFLNPPANGKCKFAHV